MVDKVTKDGRAARVAFLAQVAFLFAAAMAGFGSMPMAHAAPRKEAGRSLRSRTLFDPALERQAAPHRKAFARPKGIPFPRENPTTPAKVALGRALFFDPRLSASRWISCATCHNPALAWGDGLPRALGHGMQELGRRTPTILNVAWVEPMMWDGRYATLEEQALGPILSKAEMAMAGNDEIVSRLTAVPAYRPLFEAAFPGEPVSVTTLSKAIAAYERTIVSGTAPFDAWVAGDARALTDSQKRGFLVFQGKGNCAACHSGWRFTDDSFHDIGVADTDRGRGALDDFKEIEVLQHAFKTPTLRNVDRRAPFLHDGSEPTLDAVVDFYDAGGRAKRPSLSNEIRPLGLTASEKADLVSFLIALTSIDAPVVVPDLPR